MDDYIEQNTGRLAVLGTALLSMLLASSFWHWLAMPSAVLGGALIVPVWRWYRCLFSIT